VLLSSRPGRVAQEYLIDIGQPRRIEDPEVADLAGRITDDLGREIRRHAHAATAPLGTTVRA